MFEGLFTFVVLGLAGVTASEPRISNSVVEVALEPSGALRITDTRIKRAWVQKPFAQAPILKQARADGSLRLIMELFDRVNKLDLHASVVLSRDTPELEVTLNSKRSLRGWLAWPLPFVAEKGTALVIPQNEGMLYPVYDESVPAFRLVAYGGHDGVSMPWFGIEDIRSGAGVMGIIATPDDALLELARTSENGLVVRTMWANSRQEFGYERRILYTVFDRGGYVAQAKHYREYAKKIGLFKSLAQKKAENANVDLLIGAVNVWNWDMDKLALAREMKSLGMDRVLWSNGGSPEEIAEINRLGYLTSRYENLGDVWPTGSPEYLRSEGWPQDLVWLASGKMRPGWVHYEVRPNGTKFAYPGGTSNSQAILQRLRCRLPEELKRWPYTCRFEDTTTATPFWEDYNPAHPASRSDDRRYKMQLLEFLSKDMKLVIGSETGVDAAAPFLHYFEGMLSIVRYRLPDAGRDMEKYKPPTLRFMRFQVGHFYRIPLWELVYHDSVVAHWYWGDSSNKVPEVWDRRDLFNILYGTPPLFLFTKEAWEHGKLRFVQTYRNVNTLVRKIGYDEMLSHEFLSTDHAVQRTRWSSGAEIVVNFGKSAYRLPDRRTIESMAWLETR